MEVIQLNVGKTDDARLEHLIENYFKRINRYIKFRVENIQISKKLSKVSSDEIKKAEGELILKKILKPSYVILLDEKGQQFSSVNFARHIESVLIKGYKRVYFVSGGAFGFSNEVYKISDELLSLSSMTTTHQLIRLFFIEQFYRALTILKNHPYHNE